MHICVVGSKLYKAVTRPSSERGQWSHLLVIFQELLHICVDVATTKHDLSNPMENGGSCASILVQQVSL